MVETDVHYPTDVSLLWDAMRCLLRETGRAAKRHGAGGWRQWRYLSNQVRRHFNRVRSTRRAKRHPAKVAAYLARCAGLVERSAATLATLRDRGVGEATCQSIGGLIAHARRQIDQVERRLLREQPGMFAGYAEFCGIPIVVAPTPQRATAWRDPRTGLPIITVDPGVMGNWTTSRVFAIAHECGHHMLGHTMPPGTVVETCGFLGN